MLKKIALSSLLFLFLFEIGSRTAMSALFRTPFFNPAKIIYNYYPILEDIEHYEYDSTRVNLLILGGSVIYNDTVHVGKEAKSFLNMPNTTYDAHFCAMDKLIPAVDFNVLSLAMSGHNSLDSWYKYEYCKNHGLKFDYILPYHGINDLRTNNIWRSRFDINYRHVEFYDDLYIIHRHPEMNISTIPFMVDWIILGLQKRKQGDVRYISKDVFMGLLTGSPEQHVYEGHDLKTIETFTRNYTQMIKLAKKSGEKIVLTTYAWFQPDDYDFRKFYRKQLPYYDEQLFPTELYGMPEHIKKGLIEHNKIVESLSMTFPEMPFINMYSSIPHSKEYFNDVCHLTDQGCKLMAHTIYTKLKDLK